LKEMLIVVRNQLLYEERRLGWKLHAKTRQIAQ
jgi:hypothetical protein